MKYLNKVQLIGNIAADPILAQNTDRPLATFVVATNRRWKDAKGAMQELAEFHNIAAWGGLAEHVLQIFKKSKLVYIEGYLKTHQKEVNGTKHFRTEIVAENVIVLSKPEERIESVDE